jgi:hypothetical protein
MFKKKFALRPARQNANWFYRGGLLGISLLLLGTGGCQTTPPFPQADLSEPGWKVHQGQAVWRARHNAAEIAGEILLAADDRGRTFVQFTKTPFPFVIAQTMTNAWQIESPTQDRRYSGHGTPPGRVIWFQLPAAGAGLGLPKPWSWKNSETGWRLENHSTGESLEGYFTQ